MAVRIRANGDILCAAMHPEEPGDTYLHDGLHYKLSVELRALVTDKNHIDGHGQWWWADDVPEGIEVDRWWETEPLGHRVHAVDGRRVYEVRR